MSRLLRPYQMAFVFLIVLFVPQVLGAQNLSPAANGAFQAALGRAVNDPNFDYEAATDQITAASQQGVDTGDQLSMAFRELRDAFEAAKKAREGDRNASANVDWNLGMLYRGSVYKVKFPLTNNCRVPVTISIVYPPSMTLTGPESVTVPAKSTVNAEMTYDLSTAFPAPSGPNAWLFNWQCVPLTGALWMSHPEVPGGTKVTPPGTWTYVCPNMVRAYSVYTHLHYREPDDSGGGGGGGRRNPQKPARPACHNLWLSGEFFAQGGVSSPEICQPDLAREVLAMIEEHAAPLAQQHPADWAWMPSSSEIQSLSTEDLMALKEQILSTARAEVGP